MSSRLQRAHFFWRVRPPCPKAIPPFNIEGGHHGAIFGISAYSGTARVRRGLQEGTDVSLEASVVHVDGQSSAGTHPNIYSTRAGVKYQLLPFLSFVAGVGGGGSAGGGFVAPDAGVIVAWENRYAIPFLGLRGGLSQPLFRQSVDTSTAEEPIGTRVYNPQLTWMGGGTLGLRVPLGDMKASGSVRGALLGGLSYLHMADVNDKESVVGLGAGGEILF